MTRFPMDNKSLRNQFAHIEWLEDSGISEAELKSLFENLMQEDGKKPRAILKAELFALICERSRIAIDKEDIFQDKLFDGNLLNIQRWNRWYDRVVKDFLSEETKEIRLAAECGAYDAGADFGHTSPNSALLLKVGFSGLLERVERAERREGLSEKQKQFYLSCKTVLNACKTACLRWAEAIEPYNSGNGKALRQIAFGAPTDSYEAMQLLIVYFFLHEYVGKTRVRTLGRLDVLLYPFYQNDIRTGKYTKAEIKEMLTFFLNKFSAANVPYGLPFCLGGMDGNGEEVTGELSCLIVETYQELDIYSPKIHVRVSDKTPEKFVKLVLDGIRSGKSSFVFCNDAVAVRALTAVGVEENDAREYTPIGCYEPAVWGKEIGCTGNAHVNMAKAIEFVLSGGVDVKSGKTVGVKPNKLDTFEDFYRSVKEQIAYMAKKCIDYVRAIEKHYGEIGPDPLLSCMYDDSVARGVDVFEGGAKYNNSSLYFYYIATLVDSLTAIKKFVYDEKRLTVSEFYKILKNNWEGQEKLRLQAQRISEKYGNEDPLADWLTKDISDYCASLANNVPNARGGVFKAALFSIDHGFPKGKRRWRRPTDGMRASRFRKICAPLGRWTKKGCCR